MNGAARLERLREVLGEEGLDGLLVHHLPNVRYLTGFQGSTAVAWVDAESARLFTDGRYGEQSRRDVAPGVLVTIVRDGLHEAVGAFLDDRSPAGPVGFEADHLTVDARDRVAAACPDVKLVGGAGRVEGLRVRKDADEVAAIQRAVTLAEESLEVLLPGLEEGMTEREVAADLGHRLRRAGSEEAPFDPIVAFGENSALPHARPGERKLREGDLVLVDFGARVAGYCSDLTRTFVVGKASAFQRRLHDAVVRAQEEALQAVAAGTLCADVDAAARDALEAAGLAEHFVHSTGHGIGLEVHEDPRLHRSSEASLEAGAVVTVEPGAYVAGRGGVRIEDDVLVEEDGSRRLSSFSTILREL